MGATSTSRQDDAPTPRDGTPHPVGAASPGGAAPGAGPEDAATRELVAAAGVSDRCTNCGAPLASDQRYCVNCGQRRGKARFAVAAMTAPQAVETTTVQDVPRRQRVSAGMTLILGVGALLLAMLVGVLIGHNNSNSQRAASAPPVQVVTVGGGGAGAGSTPLTSGAGTSSASGATNTSTSHKHATAKKVVVTKQVVAKANQAAASALGGNSANLAPATVQQGGSCQNGQAGCQGGKFTGNFFGP